MYLNRSMAHGAMLMEFVISWIPQQMIMAKMTEDQKRHTSSRATISLEFEGRVCKNVEKCENSSINYVIAVIINAEL